MESRKIVVLLAAAVMLLCAGCGKSGPTAKKDVLAAVNGHCLLKKDFEIKTRLYGLEISGEKETRKFLNLMINDYLILEQAKKDKVHFTRAELEKEMQDFVPGYSPHEIKKVLKKGGVKYKYWLKDIKEKIIRKKEINYVMKNKITIDNEDVKDYFWSNIIHFRRVHKVRARQIVVADEEKAKEILKKIKSGGKFEELAKKYSTGTEAVDGGDLGYFSKKDMPVFITRVVFNMKKGKTSNIIKSPYGYHIFKCEGIKHAETPKFEDVKEEVYASYFEEKKHEYFNEWMEEIRKKADIKIFEDNFKTIVKDTEKKK